MNRQYFQQISASGNEHPATVIISWPTGTTITVQCGGVLCLHRSREGICLPFMGCAELGEALMEMHPGCGVDNQRQEGRASALSQNEANALDLLFIEHGAPLHIDRDRLSASCEAWLWIRITSNTDPFLQPFGDLAFGGYEAILTWPNCD